MAAAIVAAVHVNCRHDDERDSRPLRRANVAWPIFALSMKTKLGYQVSSLLRVGARDVATAS
jgi:hypothetical protein